MAKEIAIGKRAKISKAQQYMLLSVLGTSIVLGISISLVSRFIQQIQFNTDVIISEEKAIANYSKVIKNVGICISPKGDIYSDEELNNCDPESIEVSQIPNTLRATILQDIASNPALNSVPNEEDLNCINPKTKNRYTYSELRENYKNASGSESKRSAIQLIKSCSALRIIPDALPSQPNEEALLASLNKLFDASGWLPQSISPSGSNSAIIAGEGAKPISVNLSVEADSGTTMRVLNNIERSIREFNIDRATIEWGGNNTLSLRAQANAYYINPSVLKEETKTIKAGSNKK